MPTAPLYAGWARTHRNLPGPLLGRESDGSPLPPVEIPYSWLRVGVAWWSERPRTSVSVSVTGGSTANLFDATSTTEYGDLNYSATLDTDTAADAPALAKWVLTYYAVQPGAVPRQRFLQLPLVPLNARTTAEQQLILGVSIGRRIRITNPPTTWPAGLSEQVVEGIAHSVGADERTVTWRTSPVVGSPNGTSGPWFRLGTSTWGGSDVILF